MEKCDLDKLVKSRSERVSFVKCSGASDVWPQYEKVLVDGAFCCHVRCVPCGALLKWKSRDGTSGLKAHVKSCRSMKRNGDGTNLIYDMPGFSKTATSGDRKMSIGDRNIVTNDLFAPSANAAAATQRDELDSYMASSDSSDNILAFWRDKTAVWPRLSSVARTILAIPATQTSSERVCFRWLGEL